MENMMKKNTLLIAMAEKLGKTLKTEYSDFDAIAMIHNHAIISLELLSHYYPIWKKTTGIEEKDLSPSQIERLITITRETFIHAMSSCEYCAKQIVLQKNHADFQNIIDALNSGGRVYLGEIMGRSKGLGLIPQTEYDNWDTFRIIRNAIVHNNAVMERDHTFDVNGFNFESKKGKQLHTKWDVFPFFVSIILEQFDKWVDAIHNH